MTCARGWPSFCYLGLLHDLSIAVGFIASHCPW